MVEASDGEVASSGYNLIFVKLTNGAIFMVYVFRPQLSLTGVRDPMATVCHASPGTTEPSNSPREDSDDGWLADQYSRYPLDHCPPLQVISFHAKKHFVLFSQGGVSQQTLVSQPQKKGDF